MRYENLMNRAETALKSVDNYETVANKEKKKDTESRIGDNITTSKISPTDAGTNYEGSNDEDEEVGERAMCVVPGSITWRTLRALRGEDVSLTHKLISESSCSQSSSLF